MSQLIDCKGSQASAPGTRARAKACCPPIHGEASLSLTGARAKAWCLLIHEEASLTLSRGAGRKPGVVPPHTRGSASHSRSSSWCCPARSTATLPDTNTAQMTAPAILSVTQCLLPTTLPTAVIALGLNERFQNILHYKAYLPITNRPLCNQPLIEVSSYSSSWCCHARSTTTLPDTNKTPMAAPAIVSVTQS